MFKSVNAYELRVPAVVYLLFLKLLVLPRSTMPGCVTADVDTLDSVHWVENYTTWPVGLEMCLVHAPFSHLCMLHLLSGALVVWWGSWQLQRVEETSLKSPALPEWRDSLIPRKSLSLVSCQSHLSLFLLMLFYLPTEIILGHFTISILHVWMLDWHGSFCALFSFVPLWPYCAF